MIGGLALRHALAREEVGTVTTIGRRATGLDHPKLTEIEHDDFTDFGPVADHLAGQDAALFCLGVYTGQVADEAFRRITVDFTVAFAEALHRSSPEAAFCLLSGQGADPSETSRVAFARYKGMAENALLGMGFPRVHLFRPGYVYPVERREEPNLGYRIMRGLWPLVRRIYPNAGIPSDDLARVMVEVALRGTPRPDGAVLENRDIRRMATLTPAAPRPTRPPRG